MQVVIILVFVVGYLAIALEHPIKINKTATAILTGVLLWTLYALSADNIDLVGTQLNEHLSSISSILFFLLGAMTIVELLVECRGNNPH